MFEGAYVIVAGGSSGIGLATAKAFAARGAHVAVIARNPETLETARSDIASARKNATQRVATAAADLSRVDQTEAAFAALTAAGFVPDVLVNSAGIIIPGEFLSMSKEDFDRNMINGFDSMVNSCRVVAPVMVKRGHGHIVNISSGAGYLGLYGYTGYSAAKFAVMGFTESLRYEMKPHGVRVSVACPPDTDTPGLTYEKTLRPPETEKTAGIVKAIPPETVARAIVRSVERNKFYILPDLASRLGFRIMGLWHELWIWKVDSDVAKSRKERGLK